MSDSDLSALIGSRLCHDLVSPLGAIGNGLELLQMMQPPSPELDLVNDAVKMAQARVRLFRLAFGAASPEQTVHPTEITQGFDALAANGRIALTCDVDEPMARPSARRLILAAMCAETALAWGGALWVTAAGLRAQAARFRLDPALWQALTNGDTLAEPSSASVHFALLAASGPVLIDHSEDRLQITI